MKMAGQSPAILKEITRCSDYLLARRLALRAFVAALGAARHVGTSAAMASAAAAMQREAVALAFMAVRLAGTLRRRAGDEGGQTQVLFLTAVIRAAAGGRIGGCPGGSRVPALVLTIFVLATFVAIVELTIVVPVVPVFAILARLEIARLMLALLVGCSRC